MDRKLTRGNHVQQTLKIKRVFPSNLGKTLPKKFQITLISGMLSVFTLLLWAFLSAALRAASDDPECASKLARIRRGFGITKN